VRTEGGADDGEGALVEAGGAGGPAELLVEPAELGHRPGARGVLLALDRRPHRQGLQEGGLGRGGLAQFAPRHAELFQGVGLLWAGRAGLAGGRGAGECLLVAALVEEGGDRLRLLAHARPLVGARRRKAGGPASIILAARGGADRRSSATKDLWCRQKRR